MKLGRRVEVSKLVIPVVMKQFLKHTTPFQLSDNSARLEAQVQELKYIMLTTSTFNFYLNLEIYTEYIRPGLQLARLTGQE